jgi:hypothetical protein
MRLVTLLVLVACGAPARTPIANAPPAGAPTTPAPTLSLTGDQFEVSKRFPMVANDGRAVLLAMQDNDGGRGYPNLRFVIKDRTDRVLATHVVLAADEADGYLAEPAVQKRLAPRLELANRWLAEQHAKYHLVSLQTLITVLGPDGYGDVQNASYGPVVMTWKEGVLDLANAGTRVLHVKTPKTWLADKRAICDGCDPCTNPAFLGGASIDTTRTIAVVTISYTGSDTCWEPPDQQHIVTW